MSFFPGEDPAAGDHAAVDAIEQLIIPRTNDIGGFEVRRALPTAKRRLVGPFIFFDRMGPARFQAGTALDVRPRRPRALPPETEPGAAPPLLDRETLEELRAAVGPGRLPRLIAVFAAETKARVRRMHGLTDSRLIEDEAHSLKAAAATFGAAALRDAAQALESACRDAGPTVIRDMLDTLPGLAERSIATFPGHRAESTSPPDRPDKG